MKILSLFFLLLHTRGDDDFDENVIIEPPKTRAGSDDAWEQQAFYRISKQISNARIDEFGVLFMDEFSEKFGVQLSKGNVMEFYRRYHRDYILGQPVPGARNGRSDWAYTANTIDISGECPDEIDGLEEWDYGSDESLDVLIENRKLSLKYLAVLNFNS